MPSHGMSDMCRRTIMCTIQPNYFGFVTKSQPVSWCPAILHVNTHYTASKTPGTGGGFVPWVPSLRSIWAQSHICFYNCSDSKRHHPCSPLVWLCNCQHEHRSVKRWFPQAVLSSALEYITQLAQLGARWPWREG